MKWLKGLYNLWHELRSLFWYGSYSTHHCYKVHTKINKRVHEILLKTNLLNNDTMTKGQLDFRANKIYCRNKTIQSYSFASCVIFNYKLLGSHLGTSVETFDYNYITLQSGQKFQNFTSIAVILVANESICWWFAKFLSF